MPEKSDLAVKQARSLPQPLAQIYLRAHKQGTGLGLHNNAFYVFEVLIKLLAIPLLAEYIREVKENPTLSVPKCAGDIAGLRRPNLGNFFQVMQGLAGVFGKRGDASMHPFGKLHEQLKKAYACNKKPHLAELQRQIQLNLDPTQPLPPPDDFRLYDVLDVIQRYRNKGIGHGAAVEEEDGQRLGTLFLHAADELLAGNMLDFLGSGGGRLICVTEVRLGADPSCCMVEYRNLSSESWNKGDGLSLSAQEAATLTPGCTAVLWSNRKPPLVLDPWLSYAAGERRGGDVRFKEDRDWVVFLNEEKKGRIEYLNYTKGDRESREPPAESLDKLLGLILKTTPPTEYERFMPPGVEPRVSPPAKSGMHLGDYALLAELGGGQDSVLFLARQFSLDRVVVLKLLRYDAAGSDDAQHCLEREIKALNESISPQVVRLLAGGKLLEGDTFYAMDYLPGADLAAVRTFLASESGIRAVHQLGKDVLTSAAHGAALARWKQLEADCLLPGLLDEPATLPSRDRRRGGYVRHAVTLVRDLARSLQAVRVEDYAHRVLQPRHLILAPDGAKLTLMDFGWIRSDNLLVAENSGHPDSDVLRYAAPEQLLRGSEVNESSFVRGLGVVLWELLTRTQLYDTTNDRGELFERVALGRVVLLGEGRAKFHPDLAAIVAQAVAPHARERIQTVKEFADYLTLHLEGKEVPSRTPAWPERTRRWAARHRPYVWAAAIVAAVVVLSVTMYIPLYYRAQQQLRAVHLAEAREAGLRARGEAQFKSERETVDRYMTRVSEEKLLNAPGLQLLRQELLEGAVRYYESFAAQDRGLRGSLADDYFRLAALQKVMGAKREALLNFQKCVKLRRELLAEQPVINGGTFNQRKGIIKAWDEIAGLQSQLGQGSAAGETYRAMSADIREMIEKMMPEEIKKARADGDWEFVGSLNSMLPKLPNALVSDQMDASQQAKVTEILRGYFDSMIKTNERQLAANPTSLPKQRALADAYVNAVFTRFYYEGKYEEGLAAAQKALELRQQALSGHPADLQMQRELAEAYAAVGAMASNHDDAEADALALQSFQLSQAIYAKLAHDNPSVADYQIGLGRCDLSLGETYRRAKRWTEALTSCEAAAQIFERVDFAHTIGDRFAWNAAGAYLDLSELQNEIAEERYDVFAGETDRLGEPADEWEDMAVDALDSAQTARNLDQTLAEASPEDFSLQSALAWAEYKVGLRYKGVWNRSESLEALERAATIQSKLIAAQPDSSTIQANLALTEVEIGRALAGKDALTHYDHALDLYRERAGVAPIPTPMKVDYADASMEAADLHEQQGHTEEAERLYNMAATLYGEIAAADVKNGWAEEKVIEAYRKGGDLLRNGDKPKDARRLYERAAELLVPIVAAHPEDAAKRIQLAEIYASMYNNIQMDEVSTAMVYARKRLDVLLIPASNFKTPEWRNELAGAYGGIACLQIYSGQPREAVASGLQGLEVQPEQLEALYVIRQIACAYSLCGQADKALALAVPHRDEPMPGEKGTLGETTLAELTSLRALHFENPAMDKLEGALRVNSPPR